MRGEHKGLKQHAQQEVMHLQKARANQISKKSFLLLKAGHYNRAVVKKESLGPVTENREIRYKGNKSR